MPLYDAENTNSRKVNTAKTRCKNLIAATQGTFVCKDCSTVEQKIE